MNRKVKKSLHIEVKDKNCNYRGVFYNDTSEKEFYEFGAHFSYKELYSRLVTLKNNQTQKELFKKNIKLKITRNKSNSISRKKRTINVINNNNIHLTNLNVNVNVNINNDSNNILERLNKIEQTVFKGAKINLSRNNKTCSYQRNVCNGYKNLTLINAIRNINKKNVNMNNVKSITYQTADKKIATVSKSGKVTAKAKGTVTVKATVTLKNGSKKTVTMKIKVK